MSPQIVAEKPAAAEPVKQEDVEIEVKDAWDAEEEDEAKDAWDQSSEDEEEEKQKDQKGLYFWQCAQLFYPVKDWYSFFVSKSTYTCSQILFLGSTSV